MAELADALDLGSSPIFGMGVRVPPLAPGCVGMRKTDKKYVLGPRWTEGGKGAMDADGLEWE